MKDQPADNINDSAGETKKNKNSALIPLIRKQILFEFTFKWP